MFISCLSHMDSANMASNDLGCLKDLSIEDDSIQSCNKGSHASATDFSVDELAAELTRIDCQLFRAIRNDELTSMAWSKRALKMHLAPNIVAFIQRFNHITFWTVGEVLSGNGINEPRSRARVMSHFIRLAKRLHELNNLHAEFAIISGLQSSAIYRLDQTWTCLSKRHRDVKSTFDKLAELFAAEANNFSQLRNHCDRLAFYGQADCIPYLGIYLTDLVYIDMAHPLAHAAGGLESRSRSHKMNNVLRLLSEMQRSSYNTLPQPSIECQQYLSTIRIIEELQTFVEDDHYRLSVRLEPDKSKSVTNADSNGKLHPGKASNVLSDLNVSPGKACWPKSHEAVRLVADDGKPFKKGHRKCKSDGGSTLFSICKAGKASDDEESDALDLPCLTPTVVHSGFNIVNSLPPDSIIDKDASGQNLTVSRNDQTRRQSVAKAMRRVVSSVGMRNKKSSNQSLHSSPHKASLDSNVDLSHTFKIKCVCESPLSYVSCQSELSAVTNSPSKIKWWTMHNRRQEKSSDRDPIRPQLYWVQLWNGPVLVMYAAKIDSSQSSCIDRNSFESTPSQCLSVYRWRMSSTGHSLYFNDSASDKVHRFKLANGEDIQRWLDALEKILPP